MLSEIVFTQTTWHVAQKSRVLSQSTEAYGPPLLADPPAETCAASAPPLCLARLSFHVQNWCFPAVTLPCCR